MTPLPLNPSLATLPVYQPGRPIQEVARELGLDAADIIKLASNENPLGPSPAAVAAMEQAIQSLHLYPDGNAFYLKQKLAAKLGVTTTNLILGNGSNEIIEFIGHALMVPGAEVVVSEYCFAVYPIVTSLFGAKLITVPAKDHGHDIPAMLRAITPQTRVIFVANPNNPTGTLISSADLQRLLREVPPHVLIAMDEAYVEFLDAPCDLQTPRLIGFFGKTQSRERNPIFSNPTVFLQRNGTLPNGIPTKIRIIAVRHPRIELHTRRRNAKTEGILVVVVSVKTDVYYIGSDV